MERLVVERRQGGNLTGEAGRIALLLALACALTACGVRGALEKPPAEQAQPTATADSGQGKPEGEAPKPHRGFILDGLIR